MKPIRLIAVSLATLALWPTAAQAQVSRVFVSVSGNDANDCLQPTASCRTLNGGIGKVDAQGEVIVIDNGSYAGANITKSVKINAPSGVVAFSASSVLVNAPGAVVVIRGLTLKAATPGSGDGINIQAAATVLVENCVIDGWAQGINVQSGAGAVKVDIKDSVLRNNSSNGLIASGMATISVDQSRFERNGFAGLYIPGASKVSVTRTFMVGNFFGTHVDHAGAELNISRSTVAGSVTSGVSSVLGTTRVAESVISGNQTGLNRTGGTLESLLDNIVLNNTDNTQGAITMATRQ